jgi:actin beta/gamma 1
VRKEKNAKKMSRDTRVVNLLVRVIEELNGHIVRGTPTVRAAHAAAERTATLARASAPDVVAVVIDGGSSTCKVGLAGEEAPRSIFPSIVARPRVRSGRGRPNERDDADETVFVGDEAARRALLTSDYESRYPMSRGIVNNWDDMERTTRSTTSCALRRKTTPSCSRKPR